MAMNDPLETGRFTTDQMDRFVHSICAWGNPPEILVCRSAVANPAELLVKPESLYCHEHLTALTAQHAMAHPDDR